VAGLLAGDFEALRWKRSRFRILTEKAKGGLGAGSEPDLVNQKSVSAGSDVWLGLPSWRELFAPQHHIVLLALLTHVCPHPTLTETTSVKPTKTGVELSMIEPLPS